MTNKIEQFLNEKFGEVRTTVIDGMEWYVAGDIAKILNYSTTQKLTYKVDDEDIIRKTKGEFEKTQTRVKACGVEFIYDELVLDGFQLN